MAACAKTRFLTLFLLLSASAASISDTASAQTPAKRRILDKRPQLVASIGDRGGVELYRPGQIASTPDGTIVVFDHDDRNVRAFSVDGSELWSFGREGGGPGEFRGSEALFVDRSGAILIADNENRRITKLSPDGRLVGMIPIPGRLVVRRILPSSDANVIRVIPVDTSLLWIALDSAGSVTSQTRLPDGIAFSASIVGESHVAAYDGGAVIAYRWSGRLVFVRPDGSVRLVRDGIRPSPFPASITRRVDIPGMRSAAVTRVDPDAAEIVRSVAASNRRAFVLAPSADDVSVIDVYDIASGDYIESYSMPGAIRRITALPDGRLATLETDLIPVIRIWKLDP